MLLTVRTEENKYRYSDVNEIEFILNQLDGRQWIRLPKHTTAYESVNDHIECYVQMEIIPVNRIVEITKTNTIVKEELK